MNSKNLSESGFSEWFPLKTLTASDLPLEQAAVLVIIDKELSGQSGSDILYIGRTKKPSKRILGGYLGGFGGKNTRKINQMLMSEGYLEKAAIGWVKADKPRIMQDELLLKYKEEHGSLPAWNIKKKLAVKSKKPATSKATKAPALKKKAAAAPKEIVTPKRSAKKPAPKRKPKVETAPKTEQTSEQQAASQPVEEQKLQSSETAP